MSPRKDTKPVPASDLLQAFGVRFVNARNKMGVSQVKVAGALGCAINTVRWHEGGSRCLRGDQLLIAAGTIGVPLLELFPEDINEVPFSLDGGDDA